MYAGGWFTSIGHAPRNRIAALNNSTGDALDWNPDANAPVNAVALYGGAVYAGGEFTVIGGAPRNCIAALDPMGSATAWNPTASYFVYAVAFSGDTVLVGGWFGAIGGAARNSLAAVDIVSGTAAAWNPNVNDRVYALAAAGCTVYAGGCFTAVGDEPRKFLASFSRPRIDSVTSTMPSDRYGIGQTIPIQVAFSAPVVVYGAPKLLLETGPVDRTAAYADGSGTATLTFVYVVSEGDVSDDLEYPTPFALQLDGGSIVDAAGYPVPLCLPWPGGEGSLSRSKDLIIDGVAPDAPVITSPPDGAVTNTAGVTLAGTAEANATVQLYDGAAAVGFAAVDGSGAWSFTTAPLAYGLHVFTARARDAAGNESLSSAPVTVTVDAGKPIVIEEDDSRCGLLGIEVLLLLPLLAWRRRRGAGAKK